MIAESGDEGGQCNPPAFLHGGDCREVAAKAGSRHTETQWGTLQADGSIAADVFSANDGDDGKKLGSPVADGHSQQFESYDQLYEECKKANLTVQEEVEWMIRNYKPS